MKIYTKTGDKGTTLLANGSRVRKSSLRIDSYGMVDELNAHMGHLRDLLLLDKTPPLVMEICKSISHLQEDLFSIGAELALAPSKKDSSDLSEEIINLEKEIDYFWSHAPALKNFVLPGGHIANSQAHISRCICRRCERVLCQLAEKEEVRTNLLIFFNRLSDWLFAVCRAIHVAYGIEELIWKPKK